MANYDYYEELEEQAFSDRMSRKKKPKKQKKSYKKEEIKNVKRDKKKFEDVLDLAREFWNSVLHYRKVGIEFYMRCDCIPNTIGYFN